MEKWEYHIVKLWGMETVEADKKKYDVLPYINILGDQGWELVATDRLDGHLSLFFKRKKESIEI